MFEFLKEAYEWVLPPPKTPEQHLEEARANIKMERRELRSAQMRNKIELEDAQKAFDRATSKKNKRAARQQAATIITLERQAVTLEQESEKLTNGENRINGIVRDQVRQKSLVTTMAYTNARSLPVQQVQSIAANYERNQDANRVASEIIDSVLHDSSEELAQEEARQYTADEQQRMHELMAGYNRSVNQQFIEEMPMIGGRHVSQSLVDPTLMTQSDMMRRKQAGARQLAEFLSQT